MMKNSSNAAHRPDSLAGIVAAFEGISNGYTMLNCPIGCKIPLGYTSNVLSSHFTPVDSLSFADFYFGQNRLPCTFTDEQDFVYGAEEKIRQVVQLLDSKRYGLIGVINHSGTALIGDDLFRIIQASAVKTRTMVVDSSGFTGTYADGFKTGVIKILERLAKKPNVTVPCSVNLIGPTVFHYNWKNDVHELKRMLRVLGIDTVSVICAGETICNLDRVGEAALNLVVYEEYGDSIAYFLKKEYGTPSIGLDMSAPFGLGASEAWFTAVSDFFHLSPKPVVLASKHVRMKCYPELSRLSNLNNTLQGVPFAVFGDSSQLAPLVAFLHEYLGMYPAVVGIREVGSYSYDSLKKYLSTNSLETLVMVNPDQYEIIDALNEHVPPLVFGSDIEAHLSMMLAELPVFIPVSFPLYEHVLLTRCPLLGFNGVLTIVESIINSFKRYQLTKNDFLP